MSIEIDGKKYYFTAEACKRAGVSKSTFLRWVKDGSVQDVKIRDLRGWRIFSEEDINKLKKEVARIHNIGVT